MVASCFVRRPVARLAKHVENVSGFLRNDALIRQAAQRLLKSLAFAEVESVMGGNRFAQQFGKLAQLEDRRDRIIPEIALRQRPKLDKLRIMHAQECKIGCRQGRSPQGFRGILQQSRTGLQPRRIASDSLHVSSVRETGDQPK